MTRNGEIVVNLLVSLYRALGGLVIGSVVGVAIGLAMATSRRADQFLGPLVATTYSLPKTSLVPLFIRWPGVIAPHSTSNAIQSHEDLYVTLAAAAGLPKIKEQLLEGHEMNGTTYKVHLDGYNHLDHWAGKSPKGERREFYYYDETDLMAVRVDAWKMHIGVKPKGSWWNEKSYPSVPYIFNLLMDPMEKMTPDSEEWGYAGKKFLAQKLWAPTAAVPFLQAHLKSLSDYPPSQGG
jgi:arylsulfatase